MKPATITMPPDNLHTRCWCGHVIGRHELYGAELVCRNPRCAVGLDLSGIDVPKGAVVARACGTISVFPKSQPTD